MRWVVDGRMNARVTTSFLLILVRHSLVTTSVAPVTSSNKANEIVLWFLLDLISLQVSVEVILEARIQQRRKI